MSTNITDPLKLGDLVVRNRNIMASLTRNRSVPTNVPNEANLEYYIQRAKGGCGLIMSEGTLVSQQGTEWPNAPGIWSEEQVGGWKLITDGVHQAGALIFCQVRCPVLSAFSLADGGIHSSGTWGVSLIRTCLNKSKQARYVGSKPRSV